MKQANESAEAVEALQNMIEVARCYRSTKTGGTVYCLFREDVESDGFLIRVSADGACEGGRLNGSLSSVSLLFEKIVQGDVPPYILPEILEDYGKQNTLLFANI